MDSILYTNHASRCAHTNSIGHPTLEEQRSLKNLVWKKQWTIKAIALRQNDFANIILLRKHRRLYWRVRERESHERGTLHLVHSCEFIYDSWDEFIEHIINKFS